jgi:regulator of sigma E protease
MFNIQTLLNFPIYIAWFIIVMIPLVTIHEFGHFIFARLFKVKVPEFGVGVPPKVTGKRLFGLTWSLNWIPLGAFVRITGDNDALETAHRNISLNKEDKPAFIEERTSEILSLGDVEDILDNNGVKMDDGWKGFAKSFNKKDYIGTEEYNTHLSQLKTFIGWEYDGYFKSKNKNTINTLFFSKNLIQKILILVGGVTFNIIGAFIIFVIALNTTGLLARNTFDTGGSINYGTLSEGKVFNGVKNSTFDPNARQLYVPTIKDKPSAANEAGIPNNANLVSINGIQSKDLNNKNLIDAIKVNGSKDVELVYTSESVTKTAIIKPKLVDDVPRIGIALTNAATYKSQNFFSSIGDAFKHTTYYTDLTFRLTIQFFADLVNPAKAQKALDQTSGPVMISFVSKSLFDDWGLSAVLWLMALVSISLAVFNILPIPALDGGRIMLIILEKIFGANVKKFEPFLVSSTYVLLLGAMFLILGKDINQIWNISQR